MLRSFILRAPHLQNEYIVLYKKMAARIYPAGTVVPENPKARMRLYEKTYQYPKPWSEIYQFLNRDRAPENADDTTLSAWFFRYHSPRERFQGLLRPEEIETINATPDNYHNVFILNGPPVTALEAFVAPLRMFNNPWMAEQRVDKSISLDMETYSSGNINMVFWKMFPRMRFLSTIRRSDDPKAPDFNMKGLLIGRSDYNPDFGASRTIALKLPIQKEGFQAREQVEAHVSRFCREYAGDEQAALIWLRDTWQQEDQEDLRQREYGHQPIPRLQKRPQLTLIMGGLQT
jgi:hypothetical protein